MLRSVIVAGLSTCVLGLTFGFSQTANAQTRYCWINAKTGTPVPDTALVPVGATRDPLDPNHASRPTVPDYHNPSSGFDVPGVPGADYVRVPCPHTDASTTPPMQTGILPGGVMVPGKDKGDDTHDKRDGDVKTTDTKPTDSKTPGAPVKDDKPQQADTPKTQQTEKVVTGKDDKPSKATTEKENPKATKHLTRYENRDRAQIRQAGQGQAKGR